MAPKPLNVYDMADKGVNTSKSPIHLVDGELAKAQNFQTDATTSDGCIRRRDGMAKLNSSALAGSVKGLIALPYPDNFTVVRTFYAPIDDATTNTWRTSLTGAAASWATITDATLLKAQSAARSPGAGGIYGGSFRGLATWAAHDHKIYFPGNDYNSPDEASADTPPTLYSWDGTTAIKLATVPPVAHSYPKLATGITAIVPYSKTELIIAVGSEHVTSSIHYTTVLLYDLITGTMEQLGPATEFSLQIGFAPYVYQNRIWIAPIFTGADGAGTLNVSWIRPGDPAWTVDDAMATHSIGGTNMVEFLGDLYMGTHSSVAAVATIRKRAAATTLWSTVAVTDGSGVGQSIGPLIVTADGLTILAFYNAGNGSAPLLRVLSSTDGTSWITDLDVSAAHIGSVIAGIPYLDTDGSIYWSFRTSADVGVTKKRTSAGVWSTVDTFDNLRGPILPLNVVTP